MYGFDVTEPRLRCVLPFAAEPTQLRPLRRAVWERLSYWGVPALTDEVQLVVTELATNVIKHVGPGVAATLVLESAYGHLRVELHDTSHVVPALADPQCGDECGRGLHLLAALAVGWGTLVTATGKAVWCELALPADRRCRRIQRASAVLDGYGRMTGAPTLAGGGRRSALEESATDLIADLLHWHAAQGGDPDEILDRAQTHFEAEAA
ncbi:ATP-binding protein [Streptomyces sp. NBC_01197]|uniref:ATP-binding protein n=1 Tax=Streptomyces sp. NBC_01197 TaxID=2903768 RepID=UPI002E11C7C4|nr:ATP-binding protein [Streptomyces sp. NBC_01197]